MLEKYVSIEEQMALLDRGILKEVPTWPRRAGLLDINEMANRFYHPGASVDVICGDSSNIDRRICNMVLFKKHLTAIYGKLGLELSRLRVSLRGMLDGSSYKLVHGHIYRSLNNLRSNIEKNNERSFEYAKSNLDKYNSLRFSWASFFNDIATERIILSVSSSFISELNASGTIVRSQARSFSVFSSPPSSLPCDHLNLLDVDGANASNTHVERSPEAPNESNNGGNTRLNHPRDSPIQPLLYSRNDPIQPLLEYQSDRNQPLMTAHKDPMQPILHSDFDQSQKWKFASGKIRSLLDINVDINNKPKDQIRNMVEVNMNVNVDVNKNHGGQIRSLMDIGMSMNPDELRDSHHTLDYIGKHTFESYQRIASNSGHHDTVYHKKAQGIPSLLNLNLDVNHVLPPSTAPPMLTAKRGDGEWSGVLSEVDQNRVVYSVPRHSGASNLAPIYRQSVRGENGDPHANDRRIWNRRNEVQHRRNEIQQRNKDHPYGKRHYGNGHHGNGANARGGDVCNDNWRYR